jgi:hypothetical protein
MSKREWYRKNLCIEASSSECIDGSGWTSEFSIEEHDRTGVTERLFFLRDTSPFPTEESAIAAAFESGRRKIDAGVSLQ